MFDRHRIARAGVAALGPLLLTLTSLASLAQYPTKPIRLIVPFPPGGATDSAARELSEGLSKWIGQPIAVENRPGADGAIAAQAVLSAPADGYTLLFGSSSMEGIPFTQKNAPFSSLTDFTPVSLVCRLAFGMSINADVPAKSVSEFVAYARGNPSKLNYATGSLSEVMASAQFMKATNTRMVQVPYKGGAQIVPDLATGRVHVTFGPITPMLPHVRDGRIGLLATLTQKRTGAVPQVPTLREMGISTVPGVGGLQGVFGPPKIAKDVVQKLADGIRVVMSDPAVQAKFVQRGQEPEISTPDALIDLVKEERTAWVEFIRESGIKPE